LIALSSERYIVCTLGDKRLPEVLVNDQVQLGL
jgi:hypothetical protein